MPNLLFICSKNQWRSPTAELLFKNHPVHVARSAGTSIRARIKVNQKLVDWADIIFVMETRHRQIIKDRFAATANAKTIIILAIEDDYRFGDPELIAVLQTALYNYL